MPEPKNKPAPKKKSATYYCARQPVFIAGVRYTAGQEIPDVNASLASSLGDLITKDAPK